MNQLICRCGCFVYIWKLTSDFDDPINFQVSVPITVTVDLTTTGL